MPAEAGDIFFPGVVLPLRSVAFQAVGGGQRAHPGAGDIVPTVAVASQETTAEGVSSAGRVDDLFRRDGFSLDALIALTRLSGSR